MYKYGDDVYSKLVSDEYIIQNKGVITLEWVHTATQRSETHPSLHHGNVIDIFSVHDH